MKMVKANINVIKKESRYKPTKCQQAIEEFINSDMDAAAIEYEEGEYTHPYSVAAALKNAIKKTMHEATVGCATRDGVTYLYRKDRLDG